MEMNDRGYYYQIMGAEVGPVDRDELKRLAAEGIVQPDMLIREGTESEWISGWRMEWLFEDNTPSDSISECEEISLHANADSEEPSADTTRDKKPEPKSKPIEITWKILLQWAGWACCVSTIVGLSYIVFWHASLSAKLHQEYAKPRSRVLYRARPDNFTGQTFTAEGELSHLKSLANRYVPCLVVLGVLGTFTAVLLREARPKASPVRGAIVTFFLLGVTFIIGGLASQALASANSDIRPPEYRRERTIVNIRDGNVHSAEEQWAVKTAGTKTTISSLAASLLVIGSLATIGSLAWRELDRSSAEKVPPHEARKQVGVDQATPPDFGFLKDIPAKPSPEFRDRDA